jgi:hypothetical protein
MSAGSLVLLLILAAILIGLILALGDMPWGPTGGADASGQLQLVSIGGGGNASTA